MARQALTAVLFLALVSGCYQDHSVCEDPTDCRLPTEPTPSRSDVCPAGEGPTYREQYLGADTSDARSSISEGPGGDVTVISCEASPCHDGEAHVIHSSGDEYCAPTLPPICAAGTSPRFTFDGRWRCDPPCDYIIHYGYLFLGQNVCAPTPPACGDGVPTFDVYAEAWVCRAACDGGDYDPVYLGSTLVCVPC